MSEPLLTVEGLHVEFLTRRGRVHAVRGVSFDLRPGQALGLVGESGCGKSVTSQAIMGLVQLPGRIIGGDVRWKGKSLIDPDSADYRREVCGRDIAMVFQDPMTSLDPLFSVGDQIVEVLMRHRGMTRVAAHKRAVELLDMVHIREPQKRVAQFPHEFSGGMRQRVLIAMALASEPELLVADEPTTALDVTVQASLLDLLAELQRNLSLAVLMITHDLGVVAKLCHDVAVMYAGEIIEDGPAERMLHHPSHPYTAGLLSATPTLAKTRHRLETIDGQPPDLRLPRTQCSFRPRCVNAIDACAIAPDLTPLSTNQGRLACHNPVKQRTPASVASTNDESKQNGYTAEPLLSVRNLSVHYPIGRQGFFGRRDILKAVDNVSFDIWPGETLGLVGESGSGKTTTGRAVLRAVPVTSGSITFDRQEITTLAREPLRRLRRDMQIIFQDPYSSLNPRMTVQDIVAEPLLVHGIETDPSRLRDRVAHLLELVGLPADAAIRHPHAFSGGQRQRVGIARALTLEPRFIIADEPVSALDVSIRAQVVNLMQDLQARLGLTYLFVAHDLAVVRHIADRVAIMKGGKIIEIGPADEVYTNPAQPYTRALLDAVPEIDDKHRLRSWSKPAQAAADTPVS
ncbi:ABC transporter ATP-binding protein [Ahrensia marina]|uniref:ABC transporter ATP-binding protein n=1 Tax=Ahrensia marina TaxID=1514904 RepID=UPI0035D0F158